MSQEHSVEQRYRGLVRALPDAGIVLDREGRVVDCLDNERNEALFYDDPDAVVGRELSELFPARKAERFQTTIERALETNAAQTVEYTLDVQAGPRQFEGYVAPIPGDASEVIWIAEEVTASGDLERLFGRLDAIVSDGDRSFEEKLEALLDLGCDWFDMDVGTVARASSETLDIGSASADQECLRPGFEPSNPGARSTTVGVDAASTATPDAGDGGEQATGSPDVETRLETHVEVDGRPDRRLVFLSKTPRDDPVSDGERVFLELVGQWLRYELEREELAEREQRIEAIFDQTYQFTGLLEPDGTLVEANRTALEFGGLDREDVIGEKLWNTSWFSHSEDTRLRAREAVRRGADGEFVRHELPIRGADRDAIIDFSVRPITDDDGEVTLLIPEGRDITERKRHEDRLEALNEASTRLWNADDERDVGEIVVDIAETVLDESLVAMWSYDDGQDELVPLATSDSPGCFDNARDVDGEVGSIPAGTTEMRVFREGETVVKDYRTVDAPAHPETPLGTVLMAPLGEYGQLHVGAGAVREFDDATREMIDVLASNAQAALERLARERELRRSRDRLERTEQLAGVGGWELDLESATQRWTQGTRRMHEVSDDFQPTLEDGLEFYHPDDRETVRTAVERCRETGDPFEFEARLITARGCERWVESTGEAVEENGEIVRLEGAIRDVTDRKRREQQLSVLYRIMRHNIRNEITVVQGFTRAIRRECERLDTARPLDGDEAAVLDRLLDEAGELPADLESDVEALRRTVEAVSDTDTGELREFADRIQSASDNLVSIGNKASRLRELITVDAGENRTTSLASTAESTVATVRGDHPEATVEVDDVANCTVEGNADKIEFIMRELLDNAIVHDDSDSPFVEVRTREPRDGRVAVEIADRGPGIPSFELDVLRTGHEEALQHGSGIGLWLVNWLVTDLNGALSFETDDARGTVVTVTLPVVDEPGGTAGAFDDD